MWGRARKKPIDIAYRYVEPSTLIRIEMPGRVEIWGEVVTTKEGILFAYPNEDYIIRGITGEIYPIKKEIFDRTYTVVKLPTCTQEAKQE